MPVGYTISGSITRQNMPGGAQPDLPIFVDPYPMILGDTSEAADTSAHAGVTPTQSTLKTVWADSPYVEGKQLVLATPDNATLDLRLVIDGTSMADAQSKIGPIVNAIRQQLTYTVTMTIDTATYAWYCWTGDYLVAFNQLHLFGYLVPLYLTLPRNPRPALGPV
jgi:hypothetical protein